MAAIRIRWRPAASGRSREVTNGSFVAAKLTEGHRASAAASGKSGCPVWVAMRLTSLRVRRRNVVVEFSLPGSSRSSPSADDPDRTVAESRALRRLPAETRHSRATFESMENLRMHCDVPFGRNGADSSICGQEARPCHQQQHSAVCCGPVAVRQGLHRHPLFG